MYSHILMVLTSRLPRFTEGVGERRMPAAQGEVKYGD